MSHFWVKRILKWWRRKAHQKAGNNANHGVHHHSSQSHSLSHAHHQKDKYSAGETGLKHKWSLVSHHEVPHFRKMKHIHTGYRKDLGFVDCIRTTFHLHNETFNIWTHLIPTLLFLYLIFHTYYDELHGMDLIHHIMFGVLLVATVNCFLSSSIYHMLLGHKDDLVVDRAVKMDYSGISLLIIGSFYPPIFYTFFCYPEHQFIYLAAISFLGLLGVVGPQFSFYHHDKFTPLRILLMAGSAASGFVPTFHAVFYLPQAAATTADLLHQNVTPLPITVDEIYFYVYMMYLMYGLGLIFYVTKFPECVFPGKFDVWLHSHQFWHIFVFLGAAIHYLNCINMLEKWKVDVPGGVCVASSVGVQPPLSSAIYQ